VFYCVARGTYNYEGQQGDKLWGWELGDFIWDRVMLLALVVVYLQGPLPYYKVVSFFYVIDLWNVLTITSIKEIVIYITFSCLSSL
jgi:hypothetical protein